MASGLLSASHVTSYPEEAFSFISVIRSARQEVWQTMTFFKLKLYIAGQSPRSRSAIQNIRRIMAEQVQDRCDLDIIDVYEHPQKAEDDRILATPTLVRENPPPIRRIIGDLSHTTKVLEALEITPRAYAD
jgi:circadian clock protein KaiB